MAGSLKAPENKHHDLSLAVWTRQEENVTRLKNVLRSSMDPMKYESEDLSNIITKVVMPAQIQKDVCSRDDTGQQEYARFVQERINTNEVSVWARMK